MFKVFPPKPWNLLDPIAMRRIHSSILDPGFKDSHTGRFSIIWDALLEQTAISNHDSSDLLITWRCQVISVPTHVAYSTSFIGSGFGLFPATFGTIRA
ncbi:hypothetical protein NPIL_543251 [Nephila pilipes]|uniref:Uncharacterized protein n=1 Tax=Nephila pilipes TaxID=299642 RepID=A0A8X6U610_NEPPI|nr:hypothetical protein NPIL_543251 [Nephila pilipes]